MKIEYTKSKKATTIIFSEGKVNRHEGSTLTIGAGKLDEIDTRGFIRLVRKVVRVARAQEIKHVALDVKDLQLKGIDYSEEELGRILVENMILANYEFVTYKKKEKGQYEGVETVSILGASAAFKKGAKTGEVVGGEVNWCRDLANIPGGDMTPTVLAKAAKEAAKGTDIKVTILERKDVEKLKMGLILGVDKGSAEPLKFIVMEYWGAGKTSKQKPIALVGKGITFDTGGLSLKPSEAMVGMHHDMTGGATVISAITAAAKLKLKKNVVAIIPAVENAISGEAYRPGDVLKSMDGKTVEVLNTDAEGRLILADSVTYAKKYKPSIIIDVATLTGAALVALGTHASAILTRQETLEKKLRDLGEVSGDYVWPLPLWDEYTSYTKGQIADLANIPREQARFGGTINGGMFIAQFVEKNQPWVHIDIAPRMEATSQDNLTKGATGEPVRLLVRLIETN